MLMWIEATFLNGEVWRVKAEEVADRFADTHSGDVRGTAKWQETFEDALGVGQEDKLMAFASELDWSDLEDHLFRIKQPALFDHAKAWSAALKTIVKE